MKANDQNETSLFVLSKRPHQSATQLDYDKSLIQEKKAIEQKLNQICKIYRSNNYLTLQH